MEPARIPADTTRTTEELRILARYVQGEQLIVIPSIRNRRHIHVVLRWLADRFEADRRYHEFEVNALIKQHHPDSAALRRYLVDFRYMDRARDYYWRLAQG